MTEGAWLTYSEAGRRLGLTADAIRHRVKNGAMIGSRSNSGRPLVYVGPEKAEIASGNSAPEKTEIPEKAESVGHDFVSALQAVIEHERAESRREREANEARHRAEIERLIGQIHAERSFWIERADRAELVAEHAAAQAADLAKRLADLSEQIARPWWRRLW